jgi:Arc/MetJ-type ribon-helix-helix transcriptional regulator
VRAALRLLEDEEMARTASVARDRQLVEQGLADLDRGDVVSGPRFFAEWKAKHRRAKARKVAKKR